MTLDSSALMDAADANLITTWRRLLTSANVLVEEDDDLLLASSDTAMAFFNPLFVKRPLDDPEAALERVRAFYGSWREPFLVWSRKGTNDEFVKAAEAVNVVVND